MQVVTGTGDLLVTGSAAGTQAPSPFFRNYGPDLTGLFLGDSGAFGIKVAATLMLVPSPAAVAMASYSFDDPAALLSTMGRIGAEMLAAECLAMDPFTARARMATQGCAPTSPRCAPSSAAAAYATRCRLRSAVGALPSASAT